MRLVATPARRPPARTLVEVEHLGRCPLALASACCAAAVLVVFAPALGNQFVNYDDDTYILQNPHVLGGLTSADMQWAASAVAASNWHPLTWVSLQLDASLYRVDAWGYHLGNVLLHAASSALVLWLLATATGALWASVLAAGLFALHPLRVESVAWAAERKDVLAGLFFVLAVWAYVRYARRPSEMRLAGVAAALVLGLAAKPMLVTVPFVLLFLDFWPLRRLSAKVLGAPRPLPASWAGLVVEKLPLLALAAMSIGLTLAAQHAGGAVREGERLPAMARFANAAVSYWRYLGKEFWPTDLAAFYPYPSQPWSFALAALGAGGLLVVTAAAWAMRARRPYLLVGWLWFLGMLVPVIGLVQVGDQAMADRYTYLPSIGLAVAVAWVLAEAARLGGVVTGVVSAGAVAALAACSAATWFQLHVWHDSVTLWDHALATAEDNPTARFSLGLALRRTGRLEEAAEEYRKALEFNSADAEAHNNLGYVLLLLHRPAEAAAHFESAVGVNPAKANAWQNLARARDALGRPLQAALAYATAAELYEAMGARSEARAAAIAALRLLPERSGDPEVRRLRERLGRIAGTRS